MITSITIENFKSIKEKQTIDFIPNREENLRDVYVSNETLKSLAVFGENGAGKTTLLQAIEYFILLLTDEGGLSFNLSFKDVVFLEFNFIFNNDKVKIAFSIDYKHSTNPNIIKEEVLINSKPIKYKKQLDDLSH